LTKSEMEKKVTKTAIAMGLSTIPSAALIWYLNIADLCEIASLLDTSRSTVTISGIVIGVILCFGGITAAFFTKFPNCEGCGKKIIPVKVYENGKCSYCDFTLLEDCT
jgi:hypothetical protein